MTMELFEDAFRTSSSGCTRTCACGRVFYNPNGGWDWEEGELEGLEADERATPKEWSIGTLVFDGKEYALDCDCWRDKARAFIEVIERHDHAIAKYLSLRKAETIATASALPVVCGDEGALQSSWQKRRL